MAHETSNPTSGINGCRPIGSCTSLLHDIVRPKGVPPNTMHAGFLGGSITEGVYFRDRGDPQDRSWPAWMMHILASYLPGDAVQRLNHVNGAIRQVRVVCELWTPIFRGRPSSCPWICLTSCLLRGVVVAVVVCFAVSGTVRISSA